MMGIIIWLIVGGICGWLASLIMRTDGQQGILLNIVVGIVGAAIAGLLLGKGTKSAHLRGWEIDHEQRWRACGHVVVDFPQQALRHAGKGDQQGEPEAERDRQAHGGGSGTIECCDA